MSKQFTNAEKAREIAENAQNGTYFPEDCYEVFKVKLWGKIELRHDTKLKPEIRNAIKYGAITMGVWKDEQHKQEKQQWIDKAWDWLTNQKGEHTKEDFIKAMKGK